MWSKSTFHSKVWLSCWNFLPRKCETNGKRFIWNCMKFDIASFTKLFWKQRHCMWFFSSKPDDLENCWSFSLKLTTSCNKRKCFDWNACMIKKNCILFSSVSLQLVTSEHIFLLQHLSCHAGSYIYIPLRLYLLVVLKSILFQHCICPSFKIYTSATLYLLLVLKFILFQHLYLPLVLNLCSSKIVSDPSFEIYTPQHCICG